MTMSLNRVPAQILCHQISRITSAENFGVLQSLFGCGLLSPQQANIYVPCSAEPPSVYDALCCGGVAEYLPPNLVVEVLQH